ncbi:YmdB family metallophosphoesterase [Candidatus Saccharibacteria bacterium]|nr:YmdB family metallophosphoesterase [Candidatus Saccharibacteria bacterium]
MNILYIGDVMAEPGVLVVEKVLPVLVREEAIDVVIAQAENVTDGKGMSVMDFERLKEAGVHAFTGGNHTVRQEDIFPLLEDPGSPVVGPANMTDCPGPGYKLVQTPQGAMLIVSLLGSIVGKQADIDLENPLKKIDDILADVPRDSYVGCVVNFHGDFSSEKVVIGHYLDGRASIVVGDHWHVPTADAQVLPRGTAHLTDVGMCGSLDSSLGVSFDSIIPRWRDGYQTKNIIETDGRMQFNALLVAIDVETGQAKSCQHIRKIW